VALKTSLPGIVPGSVIDYGYVLQEPGFYSTTRVDIQREAPVKLFRCRWVPYIGATASFGLLHTEGLSVTMTRDQRSVLVTGADLPAVLDEPYMPPDSESRASALFYYRRSGSKPKDFWDLEAQRLIRRATTFTKEKPIAQAMLSIKFPAGADLMTKLKAAYDWASVTLRNTTRRTAEEAEAVRADDKEKPEAWKTARTFSPRGKAARGTWTSFSSVWLARWVPRRSRCSPRIERTLLQSRLSVHRAVRLDAGRRQGQGRSG